MNSNELPYFLDTKSAIELLRIGRTKFLELVAEGQIPKPHKVGTRNLWVTKELINAITTQPNSSFRRNNND